MCLQLTKFETLLLGAGDTYPVLVIEGSVPSCLNNIDSVKVIWLSIDPILTPNNEQTTTTLLGLDIHVSSHNTLSPHPPRNYGIDGFISFFKLSRWDYCGMPDWVLCAEYNQSLAELTS